MIYRFTKKEAEEYFNKGGEIIISTGNNFNYNKSSLLATKRYYNSFEEAVKDFLDKNEDVKRPSYFV